ncbi:hypothetical protein [Streptomyces sp. NPDC051572]|uniref:hypothetical protein n=1 Tax=Streptomyces sp. NPDC051572 TaxID=3155802 RepID=UPI00344B2FCE
MTGLLEPLDDPQRLLVDLVWSQFSDAGQFPKYFYIEYFMRQHGYQAEVVLRSFPGVGPQLRHSGYRAVTWISSGVTPDPDGPVRITLAALHHLLHDPMASQISRALLAFMRQLTSAQKRILDSPFERPDLEVNLREFLKDSGEGEGSAEHIAQIAAAEWPGISFLESAGTGRLGYLTEASFFTTDAYLNAVTAALTPPDPPSVLSYTDPRALLRTLNFLDLTCELILGKSLVPRPPMDRSSLLALPASTEAEYQAGVVVLSEILRELGVPGRNPSHALGRIGDYLMRRLPGIDRAAIDPAVRRLDQIRMVRNSFVHPKPDPALIQAHHDLGLAFPVRDFAVGWDSVRAHAADSLGRLQEEIQAARATVVPEGP